MKNILNELLQRRLELKAVERETKTSFFLNDTEGQYRYYQAKKLRKQTEKAIFKILQNEK